MKDGTDVVQPTPEASILDSIVDATKGALADPVEVTPEAPIDGNPDAVAPAPEDRQPESPESPTDLKPEEPEKAEGDKEPVVADPDKKEEDPDKKEAPKEATLDDKVDDFLGENLTPEEDEGAYRDKYEASSREAHKLVTERDSMNRALEGVGVALVQTGIDEGGNPTYALAPTEEYAAKEVEIDVDALWDGMSEAEKDELDDSPKKAFQGIAQKIKAEVLKQKPEVNAKVEDKVLAVDERNGIWDSFVEEKTKTGEPRYPNADSEDAQKVMGRIYNSRLPGMDKFRNMMEQDAGFHKLGLQMMYWGASRILVPQKLAASAAAKAEAEKQESNKKETVIPIGAGGIPPAAQTEAEQTHSDSVAEGIVQALNR